MNIVFWGEGLSSIYFSGIDDIEMDSKGLRLHFKDTETFEYYLKMFVGDFARVSKSKLFVDLDFLVTSIMKFSIDGDCYDYFEIYEEKE